MKQYQHHFNAMGTRCEVQIYASDEHQAEKALTIIHHDVERLEKRYSRYLSTSFLSKINQTARVGGEIRVDEETAGLLDYANTCYQQSNGLFDISSGILRQAWQFHNGKIPQASEIEKQLQHIGWEKVYWKAPIIRFPIAGMELDFGGIVKEYAVDRAATLAQQIGIHHGIINLGGDIKVIGPRLDDEPWQIGIRHPRNSNQVLQTISLSSGALASSGDYERFIAIDGKFYSHILNPKTGWPVQQLASVSVISDFCLIAGIAATITMLKDAEGPTWIKHLGLPYLWMDIEGKVKHS